MRSFLLFLYGMGLGLIVVGCASSPPKTASYEAAEDIRSLLQSWVGKASKQDLVQKFGPPQWCRTRWGDEEYCLFRKEYGIRWVGEKLHRKSYVAYDEVEADFDSQGRLRGYQVKSQR